MKKKDISTSKAVFIDDDKTFDKSKYSIIQSSTRPKFSFTVYKNGDIVSNHAKKTWCMGKVGSPMLC